MIFIDGAQHDPAVAADGGEFLQRLLLPGFLNFGGKLQDDHMELQGESDSDPVGLIPDEGFVG